MEQGITCPLVNACVCMLCRAWLQACLTLAAPVLSAQWLCAPRGSAFMHVRPEHQRHVRPLIVSHGYGSGFVR